METQPCILFCENLVAVTGTAQYIMCFHVLLLLTSLNTIIITFKLNEKSTTQETY